MSEDLVTRLELNNELITAYCVKEVYYNSKRIEIHFTRIDGTSDVMSLQVLPFAHDTIQQLDCLANGAMSDEAFTHLKYYLTLKLTPIWREVYNPPLSSIDTKRDQHDKVVDEKSDKQKKKVEVALEVAKKNINRFFTDEYKIAHVALPIRGSIQVLPINCRSFKNWLKRIIYQENRTILDSQTINDICGLLSAQAEYDGKEIALSLRTASTMNKNNLEWIYDLTNKDWQFVKITSEGWSIFRDTIIFRRYSNQQSQVFPSRQYEPDIFDKFIRLVNIKETDEDTKLLLKIYIISLFIPDTQKVILMLHGPGGSAKTFLEELIKALVDPSVIKTLTFPRDINELIQQLSHNYIVYYDNISMIPDWISDQLCRATTGSGSSKRQLFTDDDDILYSFKRPVGFNGINLAASKPDLLDRGLILMLEQINKRQRRKPEDLWKQFEEIRPQLLGYIFDILVKVLEWKNSGQKLNLQELPRMSEFAEDGEMIARVIGYEENRFINAYNKNIEKQSEEVLESSVVALCLTHMMFDKYAALYNSGQNYSEEYEKAWLGTPTALLDELEAIAPLVSVNIKSKYWPKAAHIMSRRLKELENNLRQTGIEIEWSQDTKKRRIISIRKNSAGSVGRVGI